MGYPLLGRFAFTLAGALSLALAACSSSGGTDSVIDGGASTGCVAFDAGPASDAGAPTDGATSVLRAQVDTVVNFSCAIASCHGRSPGQGHLYLPKRQAADAGPGMNGDWYDQVVGVASKTNPSMPLVTPGDPGNSWFVHKSAGDQCAFKSACTAGNCGDRMPQANLALDPADLETVVEWVRQGAPR